MIAITGIGMMTPYGPGKQSLINGIKSGMPAYGRPQTDRSGAEHPGAGMLGEVKDFNPKSFIPAMRARRLSRCTLLAVCSAVEAVADSGIDTSKIDPFRMGVIFGTGLASTGSTDGFYVGLLENGPEGTNPMVFPETVPNASASQIAITFGIKGPNTTFSHDEISTELALAYAADLLNDGRADAVITGGAEEISDAELTAFSAMRVVSPQGMRPFDKLRSGFVPSEGGTCIVLERLSDAARRGARIYAVIAGAGFASAPTKRLHYDQTGASMASAMRLATARAGLNNVDCISASANATRELDCAEARAIKEVFGGAAPVTSIRSYTGFHFADGSMRMAATLLCMRELGMVPPICALGEAEEEGVRFLKESLTLDAKAGHSHMMLNSFSNGGSAASIALKVLMK